MPKLTASQMKNPAQRSPLLSLPEKIQLLILQRLDPVDQVTLMLTCNELAGLASKAQIGPLPVGPLLVRLFGIPQSHVARMPGVGRGFSHSQYGLKPCDTCVWLRPCHSDAYRAALPNGVAGDDWIAAVARFSLSTKRMCPFCQVFNMESALKKNYGYEDNATPIYVIRPSLHWLLFYNALDGSWVWPHEAIGRAWVDV